MAEVILHNVSKAFGDANRPERRQHDHPRRRFRRAFRPHRSRQNHHPAHGVRPRHARPQATSRSVARSTKGLTPAQRNVAMVFQQYSLYPHLTVRENMEFPLKSPLLRTPRAEITRKVAEVAEILQISHKLDNKATALSGGEMQRVSIGRALGPQSRRLSDGRTAQHPRRQTPRRSAGGAEKYPGQPRRDLPLCHP